MNTQTTQKSLPIYRGELALLLAVAINSFGVVLMLHSNAGISAISSVPYAFSLVLPFLTLGNPPLRGRLDAGEGGGTGADDPAEKIRSPVSIQLRSRIRFRGAA